MARSPLPARIRAAAAAAITALALAACTSVPQASTGRDAEAKQFLTHPGSAAIYVYRVDFAAPDPAAADTVLWVDKRLVGSTLPRTFFRVDVNPGRRVLHGSGYDSGQIALDTQAGEIYFVSLNVVEGVSRFSRVPAETGKRELLRCCSLMENWAPGQRPLLR